MADVFEITRTELSFVRLAIRASVIPSTKYSCDEPPVRFLRGKTARDLISGAVLNGFPEIHWCTIGARHEAAAAVTSSTMESAAVNRAFLLPALFCRLSRSICRSVRMAAAA